MPGLNKRKQNAKSLMWEHTRDIHNRVVGKNEGKNNYKDESLDTAWKDKLVRGFWL